MRRSLLSSTFSLPVGRRARASRAGGARSAAGAAAAAAHAHAPAAPGGAFRATLFPGDGIGPEIAAAVQTVFAAARVPVTWEPHTISTHAVTPGGDLISQEALDSVIRNGVGLMGASPRARARSAGRRCCARVGALGRSGEGLGGLRLPAPPRFTAFRPSSRSARGARARVCVCVRAQARLPRPSARATARST